MAALKDLRLTETKSLQFRFEFFNAFNHAQFNNPSGNILDTAVFGKLSRPRSAYRTGRDQVPLLSC